MRTPELTGAEVSLLVLGSSAVQAPAADRRLHDSGGYAHLIKAAAQCLLYKQGMSDWSQSLKR